MLQQSQLGPVSLNGACFLSTLSEKEVLLRPLNDFFRVSSDRGGLREKPPVADVNSTLRILTDDFSREPPSCRAFCTDFSSFFFFVVERLPPTWKNVSTSSPLQVLLK